MFLLPKQQVGFLRIIFLMLLSVESCEDHRLNVLMILQVIVELSREQIFHQHSYNSAPFR